MENRHHTPLTLCPEQIDQMREILNWWTLANIPSNNVIRFDHTESYLRSIILGRKLYELAEALAWKDPQYKSFNHMVETLIWRELGCNAEFLRSTTTIDQDDPEARLE
jgi:hypothetical protein